MPRALLYLYLVTGIMFYVEHKMQYMTTAQAAAALGVHPMTVRRYIKTGKLPVINPKGEGGPRTCQQYLIPADAVLSLSSAVSRS